MAPDPLILSDIKPLRPITVQQISYWIKDILEEAGVDTGYKAHVLAKGVSIE